MDISQYQKIIDSKTVSKERALELLEQYPNGYTSRSRSPDSIFLNKIYKRRQYINSLSKNKNLTRQSDSISSSKIEMSMDNKDKLNEELTYFKTEFARLSKEVDDFKRKYTILESKNEYLEKELFDIITKDVNFSKSSPRDINSNANIKETLRQYRLKNKDIGIL